MVTIYDIVLQLGISLYIYISPEISPTKSDVLVNIARLVFKISGNLLRHWENDIHVHDISINYTHIYENLKDRINVNIESDYLLWKNK